MGKTPIALRCIRDYDITAEECTVVEEPQLATLREHRAPTPERNRDDHELVFVDQAPRRVVQPRYRCRAL